jgi:VIT1/CCC1 family predicted Fe2+/Mn2+ transporter
MTTTDTPPAAAAPRAGEDIPEAILGRERWHRRDRGGSLRAAVFGVNDGLVSNLSLVIGVAGAGPEPRFILLAGIAGLLAGSFSMAAGEFVSMSAQRELYERQIALEREELAQAPQEEREELSLLYQAKGVPPLRRI